MTDRARLIGAVLAGLITTGLPSLSRADSSHVNVSLLADVGKVTPSQVFSVGIEMIMAPGWHTYWLNPGDSGQPTRVDWQLPDGFDVSPLEWPAPTLIQTPPITSFGLFGRVLATAEVSVPADFKTEGKLDLRARVRWLECAEICVPGETTVSLSLPVSQAPQPAKQAVQDLFQQARARQPHRVTMSDLDASHEWNRYRLRFKPPPGSPPFQSLDFYPLDRSVRDLSQPVQSHDDQGTWTLEWTAAESSTGPVVSLDGLVVHPRGWLGEGSSPGLWIASPVIPPIPSSLPWRKILLLFLSAFAGGLLLNLMPCVLPVVSIKVLSLAHHQGQSRAKVWLSTAAFSLGILVAFWVLAGLLILLQRAGADVGWGFQLQSPRFVAALAVLFFLMALDLAGVFTFGTSLVKLADVGRTLTGLPYAFASGVLATVIATPCAGPFMGSAIGVSLTQSPAAAGWVFTGLGLGMASPYLFFAAFPRSVGFLPKPGPWMEVLKTILSLPLFATVIWLSWVLSQQSGPNATAVLLVSLLILGFAARFWDAGDRSVNSPSHGRLFKATALVVGLLTILSLMSFVGRARVPQAAVASGEDGSEWQPFSEATIQEARARGQAVFVDFTAAWCLTCQVNERVTLASAGVKAAFRDRGVLLMKADWTQQDPAITRALRSYGRSGVPFYVLYPGDPSAPAIFLPEILTPGAIHEALKKLPPGTSPPAST